MPRAINWINPMEGYMKRPIEAGTPAKFLTPFR
jgi:hypothetical protein